MPFGMFPGWRFHALHKVSVERIFGSAFLMQARAAGVRRRAQDDFKSSAAEFQNSDLGALRLRAYRAARFAVDRAPPSRLGRGQVHDVARDQGLTTNG